MSVSKKEEELINKLLETNTVKVSADVILDNLKREDIAELLAIYVVLKAKREESESTLNYYIKNNILLWMKKIFTSLDEIIPDLTVDLEFMEIMLELVGKKLNLKDIL